MENIENILLVTFCSGALVSWLLVLPVAIDGKARNSMFSDCSQANVRKAMSLHRLAMFLSWPTDLILAPLRVPAGMKCGYNAKQGYKSGLELLGRFEECASICKADAKLLKAYGEDIHYAATLGRLARILLYTGDNFRAKVIC